MTAVSICGAGTGGLDGEKDIAGCTGAGAGVGVVGGSSVGGVGGAAGVLEGLFTGCPRGAPRMR